MRAVVQRVSSARVEVGDRTVGEIGSGLVVLVGVSSQDGPADVLYIATKIRELRVFPDADGRMNRSVGQAGGAILVVSQFTLYGDCRKGRRPSFDSAAPPALARALYDEVVRTLRETDLRVETGEFQAMMRVRLVNEGPVTLMLDSDRTF